MSKPKFKALGVAVIFDFIIEVDGEKFTVQYDSMTGGYECSDSEDAWYTIQEYDGECENFVAKKCGSILNKMEQLNCKFKKEGEE